MRRSTLVGARPVAPLNIASNDIKNTTASRGVHWLAACSSESTPRGAKLSPRARSGTLLSQDERVFWILW